MKLIQVVLLCSAAASAADIRLGIIGTDTSHVVVFTEMFNNPASHGHVAGARVVAAFKGGSPDIDSSWSRVDKYAEELRTKWKIELEPDIPTLCQKVDAILLESNDGRKHLPQAKLVIAAHKPMFIDKAAGLDSGGRARNRAACPRGRCSVFQFLIGAFRRHRHCD